MKYVKSMLLLVAVFVSMAYTTRDAGAFDELKPGNRAPEIHLQHLSLEGKYSLLQFWASYDATSRVNNLLLSNKLTELQREDVQMISISFDEKQSVFEETIKTDNLNLSSQINILAGNAPDVFQNYRMDTGFNNLLVGPDGVIIAVNVTPQDLAKLERL